jgi:hypothetical protein
MCKDRRGDEKNQAGVIGWERTNNENIPFSNMLEGG